MRRSKLKSSNHDPTNTCGLHELCMALNRRLASDTAVKSLSGAAVLVDPTVLLPVVSGENNK